MLDGIIKHIEVDRGAWALLEGYRAYLEKKVGKKLGLGTVLSALILERLLDDRNIWLSHKESRQIERMLARVTAIAKKADAKRHPTTKPAQASEAP